MNNIYIHIPANSLTYKQYRQISKKVMQAPYITNTSSGRKLLLWLALALLFTFIFQIDEIFDHFGVIFSINAWGSTDDDINLFDFTNGAAVAITLWIFAAGMLSSLLCLIRCARKVYLRVYETNITIQQGYDLIVDEKGLTIKTGNILSSRLSWDAIGEFLLLKDIMVLPLVNGGWLWLPKTMDETINATIEFINTQKTAQKKDMSDRESIHANAKAESQDK